MKQQSFSEKTLSLTIWVTGLLASLLFVACGKRETVHSAHDGHDHSGEHAGHGHAHVAPHGGAAVVLGDELYHLEFVLDKEAQLLHCYVLDGHMEQFVRIAEESFVVEVADGTQWQLKAIPSRATGETVGDTSHFEAEIASDWSSANDTFSATISAITVKQSRFENVAFRYPEGNENVE